MKIVFKDFCKPRMYYFESLLYILTFWFRGCGNWLARAKWAT